MNLFNKISNLLPLIRYLQMKFSSVSSKLEILLNFFKSKNTIF